MTVPSADTERIGAVAKEHSLVLAVGVNELDGGTLYNTLLVFDADGQLVLRHRKLMPTNHERLVWGLGDGRGLETVDVRLRPRRRAHLLGELHAAGARGAVRARPRHLPRADRGRPRVVARRRRGTSRARARAFVLSCCVFQRASSYPDDVPIADGPGSLGRGGSAIVGPDGEYLAGPLWDEEGSSTRTSIRSSSSRSGSGSTRRALFAARTF